MCDFIMLGQNAHIFEEEEQSTMVYHMTIAGLERDLPVCKVFRTVCTSVLLSSLGIRSSRWQPPGAPEKGASL